MAKVRKPWEQLSPNYRKRLERKGVTKEAHESGQGTYYEARGKKSAEHEKRQKREYRNYSKFARRYAKLYGEAQGITERDIREALKNIPHGAAKDEINRQMLAEAMYEEGQFVEAHNEWAERDSRVSDWWFYYHGLFQ